MRKILRGEKGLTLVETLIGVGLLGGLSLVLTQVGQQSTNIKKRAETNNSYIEISSSIQGAMKDRNSCSANFKNMTLVVGQTLPVPKLVSSLNNGDVKDLFVVGQKYFGGDIIIKSIDLRRAAQETILEVSFDRTKGKSPTVKRSFIINPEYNASNQITSCHVDLANHIEDAIGKAIEKICNNGGEFLTYDAANKTCVATPQFGPTGYACPNADESMVAIEYMANGTPSKFGCAKVYDIPRCNSEFLRRNAAGVYECVKATSCYQQFVRGISTIGGNECFGCTAGEQILNKNGVISCGRPTCEGTNATHFKGLKNDGTATCVPLVDGTNDTCRTGGGLIATGDGSVKWNCCTPDCAGAGAVCSGTSYQSANNCGMCSGAMAKDCTGADTHCAGTTFESLNDCGVCDGTRGATNATWGPWTASSMTQAKPGATCSASCTITQQRKYTRVCNNNAACSGLTCVGATEEWRDEGTAPCAGGCKGWSCSTPGLASAGTPPTTGDTWYVKPDSFTTQTGTPIGVNAHGGCEAFCKNYATDTDLSKITEIGVVDTFAGNTFRCECYIKTYNVGSTIMFRIGRQSAVMSATSFNTTYPYCTKNSVNFCTEGATTCLWKAANVTPVNGGWGDWSAWGTCSANSQSRGRSCNNPTPTNGGASCPGSASEVRSCGAVDNCLTATCPTGGTRYFFQNYQDMAQVCGASGSGCKSSSVGSTCGHQGKSPYIYCAATSPGGNGWNGLTACTYSGLTYYTSVGCNNW